MGNLDEKGGGIIHTFEWDQWAEESSQDRIFLTSCISFSGLRASRGISWSWDITGLISTIHESKNNTRKVSQLHIHSTRPKTNFLPWEKWRNQPKSWRETQRSSSYVREKKWWRNNMMGVLFQAFTCPRIQKQIFPKNGWLPNSNFHSQTLPIPMH